jgi:hypothetical protein
MTKLQQIIEALKDKVFYDKDEWQYYLPEELKGRYEQVATGINPDVHRWYITNTTVYEIEPGQFLGVDGVQTILSEVMSSEDCGAEVRIKEMKQVQSVTYI